MWWYTPVILATCGAEVGGLQSETSLGKSMTCYLKDKLKAKQRGVWLSSSPSTAKETKKEEKGVKGYTYTLCIQKSSKSL
jgi:hypothetical protein